MSAEDEPENDVAQSARISAALLDAWSESLETSEGRALLTGILCRTMTAVVGDGCAAVCPKRAEIGPIARALSRALDEASRALDAGAKAIDRAERLGDRLTAEPLQ